MSLIRFIKILLKVLFDTEGDVFCVVRRISPFFITVVVLSPE
jgi:hypothetical protein